MWRGFDLRLQRTVAIKLLAPHLTQSRHAGQRADIEAKAGASLAHPNLATVFDAGRVHRRWFGRVPYTVMEFVDGTTLQTRLRRTEPIGWATVVSIGAQVAAGLTAAHERGVVHRDVKPDNIMLTPAGVKLVDFGLAAFLPLPPAGPTRVRVGTPEYMAPEQLRGEPVTEAGDMYAFGMVLYRLLTGALPWPTASRHGTIRLREATPVIRMPPMSGVPSDVVALCDRCLSNEPGDRPSSRQAASVLRSALAEHSPDEPVPDLPPAPVTAAGPAAIPAPAASRVSGAPRRTLVQWLTVAAIAFAGLAVLVSPPWRGGPDAAASARQPAATTSDAACAVRYLAHRDRHGFAAELTVTTPVPPGWTMRLLLPPGQQITSVSGALWSQHGRHVTFTDSGSRATGATAALSIAGDLTEPTAASPSAFELNGVRCRPSIVIFTAEPARSAIAPSPAPSSDVR
ncbi:serine/threonine-protein kinase [Dactylosporangium matsuzakiense]|uniref:serine/threonine-protein kinase n=1 Tax=Dactylosporangium matsuzakiense TaxID=53360 RepID=UPI0021C35221|nr:serine/threonine-protein kinase [Dactylosporangium matsuzakiense]